MNGVLRGLCIAALGAACAVSGFAGEVDVEALRMALERQESRMADMEAKLGSGYGINDDAPEAMTSLRKNATVTLGGLVTTGYYVNKGVVGLRAASTTYDYNFSSLEMSDAELYAQIDVNDHFDAFISLDLHSVGSEAADHYGLAKSYYVRWKNICNTGLGLKIGRDDAAFGDPDNAAGYLDNWTAGAGDGLGRVADLMYRAGTGTAFANGWKYEGVTQVTPYWEGLDGALKIEASFFQNAWFGEDGYMNGITNGATSYWEDRGNYTKYRSKNMGLGSGSLRVQYAPSENLVLTASVINFYARRWVDADTGQAGQNPEGPHARNNTAVNLAFRYRPCFFNKLTIWGQYIHGWNVENIKGMNSHVANLGLSYDLTDQLTVFAQGDYTYTKDGHWGGNAHGTAFYTGATYELPVGAVLEAGWRHENYRWNYFGDTHVKARGDTIYANLGFEF